MADDPFDDPTLLPKGGELFEQLKNVDTASAAFQAVYGGGLSKADLQAIVIFCVFNFRQVADQHVDPDKYAKWSST